MNKILKQMFQMNVFGMLLVLVMICQADAIGQSEPNDMSTKSTAAMVEQWGIKPVAIRLTGSNHFIDFRYKVMDVEKAKKILDRTKKAYLVDQKTEKVLTVPVTKIGPMRGTTLAPKKDRQYFILFSNTDQLLKKGNQVSVVIGDYRVNDLTLQ